MGEGTRRLGGVGAVLLVASVGSAAAAPPRAAAKPDLVVAALSAPLAAVGTVEVTETTSVRGKARASTTRYSLSIDRKKNRGDVRLGAGRKIKATRARASSRAKSALRIPDGTRPGRYYVLACADDLGRIRERNERNNCRSSASVQVLARSDRPNPLNVTEQVDLGRAATGTIGTAGGTIAATAQNGTKFTLTVPRDALLADTEITMAPVVSITPAPFRGALPGAVSLKPDGLSFFQPATLLIEPSTPVPLAEQASFAYDGAGKDFHLYPTTRDRTKIELRLAHFTTYGVWRSTEAERAEQAARVPTRIESWAQQNLAQAMQDLKQGRATQAQVTAAAVVGYTVWANVGVKPQLAAAETNDLLADRAIAEYFSWRKSLELFGLVGELAELDALLLESALRVFRNAATKAFERCLRDPYEGSRLLVYERRAALMGLDSVIPDVLQKQNLCFRFELTFETTITGQFSTVDVSGNFTSRVRVANLQLSHQGTGEKQLDYSFELSGGLRDGRCTSRAEGVTLGAPFRVTKMDLRLVGGGDPKYVELQVYPGQPSELSRTDCPSDPQSFTTPSYWYYVAFVHLYAHQETGKEQFRITEWQQLSGSVWAVERRYERSTHISGPEVTADFTESTRFHLRHTPQSSP